MIFNPLSNLRKSRANSYRGFTFVEVLFAVILLGIGFIMIAGVFPVSIQQTAATIDESTGFTVARGALDQIQEAVNSGMPMPATSPFTTPGAKTPAFWPFLMANATSTGRIQLMYLGSASFLFPNENGWGPRWSNSVNTEDNRFGWMGFYNRPTLPNGNPAPYAQVIVVALKNPNFQYYVAQPELPPLALTTNRTTNPPTPFNAELQYDSTTGNTNIAFTGNAAALSNLAPGAFVIVEENPITILPNDTTPAAGRIYRLGAQIGPTNYQLQPGTDPQQYEWPNINHPQQFVKTYVIGRAPLPGSNNAANNPTDFSGTYSGPNQDIAAVTGIVRINQ